MVGEVSAQNLEAIVRRLSAFETRHSLSTTKGDKKGIGAARNWVEGNLRSTPPPSGGASPSRRTPTCWSRTASGSTAAWK
jgi:hypothetical protein